MEFEGSTCSTSECHTDSNFSEDSASEDSNVNENATSEADAEHAIDSQDTRQYSREFMLALSISAKHGTKPNVEIFAMVGAPPGLSLPSPTTTATVRPRAVHAHPRARV